MLDSFQLWFEYILRFSHLVAGIAWIGNSFYFIWLDSAFMPPESPRKNVEGEAFMVHGGFYYRVEKRKLYPGELPKILHWFKWEATLTWATGFLLLIVLYYLRGASLLVDPQILKLGQLEAVSVSLGILVGSWLIYDTVWNANIVRSKSLSTILSIFFFAGLIFLNTRIFSGRGAYIQTAAIFGTMMVLNVWIRILPGQTKMLAEAQAGQVPDYSVSLKSKTRSVHNTYFIFPVLFIMISNHYPAIYAHNFNWLLLIVLCVSGAMVRHSMVTQKPRERWLLLPAGVGLAALVFMTSYLGADSGSGLKGRTDHQGPVPYEKVSAIFVNRCVTCHGTSPTDDVFKVAPKGTIFETEEQAVRSAENIYQMVNVAKAMPLGNKTQMTEEERLQMGVWAQQVLSKAHMGSGTGQGPNAGQNASSGSGQNSNP